MPATIATALLDWYDRSARSLPWRATGGATSDPYAVWLSEIMLQQTTVAAVKPYFQRFLARWPTVEALAAAPLEEVLAGWAGLGYYSRARNLHACAGVIALHHAGRFPPDVAALRALPGIGDYTAAAIAAIAFDIPATVVDGNVERVVARLFAIEQPLPAAKAALRQAAATLTPQQRPGDFAQAMMDLGATLCTPRKPACTICPISARCEGRKRGMAEQLPRKAAKPVRPQRAGATFIVVDVDGRLLVRRRPAKGLLGAMIETPTTPWSSDFDARSALAHAPLKADWQAMSQPVEHVFTHFALQLTVYCAQTTSQPAPGDCYWLEPGLIAGEAIPTVFRKAIARAGAGSEP